MREFAANMIFTKRCPFCGQVILPYNDCCGACLESLPVISGKVCLMCGMAEEKCVCRKEKRVYDGLCAPYYYHDGVSDAIQEFKFHGEKATGSFLAKSMAGRIKECFPDKTFHMITPVPLYRKKLRERGYNQSELLAAEIGKILKIPVCPVLSKDFDTGPQHLTKAADREGNVAGVFSVKDPEAVRGKTILLCDDIKTTGFTLSECAKVLKMCGAKKVYCVCAALTAFGIDKDTMLK